MWVGTPYLLATRENRQTNQLLAILFPFQGITHITQKLLEGTLYGLISDIAINHGIECRGRRYKYPHLFADRLQDYIQRFILRHNRQIRMSVLDLCCNAVH